MIISESHEPGNRYRFDFGECGVTGGWCQIDTSNDASYWGNWIHPEHNLVVHFAEGDTTRVTCESDQELIEYLRDWLIWADESGLAPQIDCFSFPINVRRLVSLGFGDYLHPGEVECIK